MKVVINYNGLLAKMSDDEENDHIIRAIHESKSFYEKALIDELFHRVMPDWVFIDVGAHIGNHTVFLAKIMGLTGISIEANPKTFRTLQSNIRVNEIDEHVLSYNAAVGSRNGKAKLGGHLVNNSGTTKIDLCSDGEIQQFTLDSMGLTRVDLLKIDIEGCELECLKGARTTLLRCKPLICVEAIDKEAFIHIRDWLNPIGYRPTKRFNHTPTYIFEID